jgi:23S rRNA-/tRNA-specific pseudouridylate synthase
METLLHKNRNGFSEVSENEGKTAITTFRRLGCTKDEEFTWLELILKTGRTHQARVHCAHAKHPILGDSVHGDGTIAGFFGLHARELRITHPATGEALRWLAEPPVTWQPYLAKVAGNN